MLSDERYHQLKEILEGCECSACCFENSSDAESFALFEDEYFDSLFTYFNNSKLTLCDIQQALAAIVRLTNHGRKTSRSLQEIAAEAGWKCNKAEQRMQKAIEELKRWEFIRIPSSFSNQNIIFHLRKEGEALAVISELNRIEHALISELSLFDRRISLKQLNTVYSNAAPNISVKRIKTLLAFYACKGWISCDYITHSDECEIRLLISNEEMLENIARRKELASEILEHVENKSGCKLSDSDCIEYEISSQELMASMESVSALAGSLTLEEIHDCLYYISRIDAVNVEGAFLDTYSTLQIERLKDDISCEYTEEHYRDIEEDNKLKTQRIHIVREYASRLKQESASMLAKCKREGKVEELKRFLQGNRGANRFLDSFFRLDYYVFLGRYFKGREVEISRTITPIKYRQVLGELNEKQLSIINDRESEHIVVAAGPGSGKTKVLVHKLFSLYNVEDIRRDNILMLTFSRAAAMEFRHRLAVLEEGSEEISKRQSSSKETSVYADMITTFHSYCFDVMGRIGCLEESEEIIQRATKKICSGYAEKSKITKSVLIIDEAQDMSGKEYALIEALMAANKGMRIIAVGDDDQNIYEFRSSDSKYLRMLISKHNATKYELIVNYRSSYNIVSFANAFLGMFKSRIKENAILAHKKTRGEITVTRYKCSNLAIPVVDDVLGKKLKGSTCILTETNEEAATIAGMLEKRGLPSQLIQETEDRVADNLTDIIYSKESVVSENRVIVSTIHKSKGKEFDNVFLILKSDPDAESKKRECYVAMTRAVRNLYIHCNSKCFERLNVKHVKKFRDRIEYDLPNEIVLPIPFKGVNFTSFIDYRYAIRWLNVDDRLTVKRELLERSNHTMLTNSCHAMDGEIFDDEISRSAVKHYCYNADGDKVISFSKEMEKKLYDYGQKGFYPSSARIRLTAIYQSPQKDANTFQQKQTQLKAQQNDVAQREYKIILPTLVLTRIPLEN